jgi:hypothetical protein
VSDALARTYGSASGMDFGVYRPSLALF